MKQPVICEKKTYTVAEIMEILGIGIIRTNTTDCTWMIKDFWMPNKNWQGCNVNDPSARYLSNYGDSGK